MICYPNFNGRLGTIHISDVRPCCSAYGGEEQPVPGDATFNKEGDGQKLLAPAVRTVIF